MALPQAKAQPAVSLISGGDNDNFIVNYGNQFMQSQFSMEVTPSMREASKTLMAPPSGGKPNERVGRNNISSLSLLKSLEALSQYPNLTSKWEKENSELYLRTGSQT